MRVLTGIQPTNNLHIGNLFGALLPAVEMQKSNELFMMIVDYHAITVPHEPKTMQDKILDLAMDLVSCGIDPEQTILFIQSNVPEVTELTWILNTIMPIGELRRMTQFKDKSGSNTDGVSVALYTYPILMAADILLYDTKQVPVGEDQKQHVELTRDLAQRFNNRFGKTFEFPEPIIRKTGARILSLTDPNKKMSKSDPSAKSYILITDEPEIIKKKIMSAVTDSEPGITLDKERRGLYNLLTIFSLVTETPADEITVKYQEKGMKKLKEDLAEALIKYLAPIQVKIKEYMDNPAELERTIKNGSNAARDVADETLLRVKKAIGVNK